MSSVKMSHFGPSHVALLRGVNVGGHGKLAMADLRAAVEAAGFTDVATYIQSGNVVFTDPAADDGSVVQRLQAALAEHLTLSPPVVVLTRAELAAVLAANPWPDEPDPRTLHVVFRDQTADAYLRAAISDALAAAARRGSNDDAHIVGRHVHLHLPDGMGRSVLATELAKRKAAIGTARNWTTITKLMAMLPEPEGPCAAGSVVE